MIQLIEVGRVMRPAIVTAAAGLTVTLLAVAASAPPSSLELRPTRIAATSFVGTPSAIGAAVVGSATIAPASIVRAPMVAAGGVSIGPMTIGSAAVVRQPTVAVVAGGQLAAPAIPSTSSVPAPAVAHEGAQTVAAGRIVSTAVLPVPVLTAGPVSLAPSLIGSAAVVRMPNISVGPAAVTPASIASAATLFAPAVSASAALWTPADAATAPVFWLDAQTPASLDAPGGPVASWASRIGVGSAAQADAQKRPLFSATGLNGYPAVTFDGTSDYLSLGSKTGFPIGNAASTMAMIGGDGGGAGDRWIMVYGTDSQTRSMGQRDPAGFASLVELNAAPGYVELDNGGSYTGTGGFGVAIVTAGVAPTLTSTFDGAALQTISAAGGAQANTSPDYGWIGAFAGSSTPNGLFWLGPMQEILLWGVALTTDDRQKLEGYLAWRWGQQGRLPAQHPYKATAPVVQA